jgi:hypothetical protein
LVGQKGMLMRTITGLYNTFDQAKLAVGELEDAGIPSRDIISWPPTAMKPVPRKERSTFASTPRRDIGVHGDDPIGVILRVPTLLILYCTASPVPKFWELSGFLRE